MTVSNIDYFYNIQNNVVDPAPPTKGGNELTYVRFIAQQTQSYTTKIQQATTAGTNSVTYPANNELADQLKIVVKLIPEVYKHLFILLPSMVSIPTVIRLKPATMP